MTPLLHKLSAIVMIGMMAIGGAWPSPSVCAACRGRRDPCRRACLGRALPVGHVCGRWRWRWRWRARIPGA